MKPEVLKISSLINPTRENMENYKSLRANISFATDSPKVILLTSSIPGEGKSTVSLNLASQFAKSGEKVLYIDCDLRKSQYAKKLSLSGANRKGLTEVLQGTESASDQIWNTDVKNLYCMLSGYVPENPSELLNTQKFSRLLTACRKMFAYIIIDAPPVGSVIDAAVICKHCDGVVFVIASDMVSRRIAERAVQQLERAGGNVLGCVLNKIKYSNRALYGTYGTNKYYYGNYHEYYSDGDKNEA